MVQMMTPVTDSGGQQRAEQEPGDLRRKATKGTELQRIGHFGYALMTFSSLPPNTRSTCLPRRLGSDVG